MHNICLFITYHFKYNGSFLQFFIFIYSSFHIINKYIRIFN